MACAARTLDPDPRYSGTLKETVEQITAAGGSAQAFQADLSSTDDRHALVASVADAMGPVDILVNNAAVTFLLPIDTFPEKRFRLMVEMQVWAALELSQLVIPAMRGASGGGWILNITSRAATKPVGPPYEPFFSEVGSTVYGLCKAALDRMSIGMAAELGKDGIAVNALAPWDNVATSGATHPRPHRGLPAGAGRAHGRGGDAALQRRPGHPHRAGGLQPAAAERAGRRDAGRRRRVFTPPS